MIEIHGDQPEVMLFRLVNGMSIITAAQKEEKGWRWIKPLQILSDVSDDGHSELLMFPFLPASIITKKDVFIAEDRILFQVPLIDSVIEYALKFSEQYYDREKTIGVKDVTREKRAREVTHDDIASLLNKLTTNEKNENGTTTKEPGNGGSDSDTDDEGDLS